ncbi:cellulose synthase/poly-beta-1,6-N-acetylglucosamine synthase-like glycosyltransferase [Flavobacteriaceae bacterium MAR_2010_72]|nr:cellulose synthase/poly-beta-1,6-N-acetylglucosamine synthase-like glycosyltransferase [Flavobacteriaceae bacterium MAR_2010_72]
MLIVDVLLYTFVIVVSIQIIFYLLIFGKFSFYKEKKRNATKNISISVIICAKNEAKNLKRFLPSVIAQEYHSFEIVLINDGSTDKTLKVMERFKALHDNIKIVNVKNIEAFWGNKKYALTLGIKAATHNFLLFTDADCEPLSKYWIRDMSSHFSTSKSIVLGYGSYKKIKNSFLNKLIRFETLLTATQYFSYAQMGLTYMGVGRNLAYRKELFFNANGFMNHMHLRSGDDDLFVNQIATKNNTSICVTPNSFTESIPKQTFKDWILQKRRHISTAKYYKLKHKLLLGIFYFSQLLFWILFPFLLIVSSFWELVVALVLLRFISANISLGLSSKKLKESDLIPYFPFLEVVIISIQFFIFIKNILSRSLHWK